MQEFGTNIRTDSIFPIYDWRVYSLKECERKEVKVLTQPLRRWSVYALKGWQVGMDGFVTIQRTLKNHVYRHQNIYNRARKLIILFLKQIRKCSHSLHGWTLIVVPCFMDWTMCSQHVVKLMHWNNRNPLHPLVIIPTFLFLLYFIEGQYLTRGDFMHIYTVNEMRKYWWGVEL